METIDLIVQIISTVGFPICVSLIMFWYVNKIQEQHSEDIKMLRDEHKEETAQMTQAINNNTLVLQKVVDKLCE